MAGTPEPDAEPSPVPDARWAIDQAAAAHPGVPVVLLGHSMGARTAVHVADHPGVVGVVALAPWLERSDPVRALAGRHLIAGHGSRDKITSARVTRAYVERAREVAASAEFVDMGRLGHYMLHRPRRVEPVRPARALSRSSTGQRPRGWTARPSRRPTS